MDGVPPKSIYIYIFIFILKVYRLFDRINNLKKDEHRLCKRTTFVRILPPQSFDIPGLFHPSPGNEYQRDGIRFV